MSPTRKRTPLRSRRLALLAAATGATAAAILGLSLGCNSPFIPVPPPGDPTFVPVQVSDGFGGTKVSWEVKGAPQSEMQRALVTIYNVSAETGVVVRAGADGAYTSGLLDGKLGDPVQIYYRTAEADEQSPVICRVLVEGLSHLRCDLAPLPDAASD